MVVVKSVTRTNYNCRGDDDECGVAIISCALLRWFNVPLNCRRTAMPVRRACPPPSLSRNCKHPVRYSFASPSSSGSAAAAAIANRKKSINVAMLRRWICRNEAAEARPGPVDDCPDTEGSTLDRTDIPPAVRSRTVRSARRRLSKSIGRTAPGRSIAVTR